MLRLFMQVIIARAHPLKQSGDVERNYHEALEWASQKTMHRRHVAAVQSGLYFRMKAAQGQEPARGVECAQSFTKRAHISFAPVNPHSPVPVRVHRQIH